MPFRLIDSQVAIAVSAVNTALTSHEDPTTTTTTAELAALRSNLAAARAQRDAKAQLLREGYALIAQRRTELDAARETGDAAAITAAEAQLAAALAQRLTLAGELDAAAQQVQSVHAGAIDAMGTAAAYAHLDRHTPVALLPVRIEARYFAHDQDNFSLWIRVYPDDVHVDDTQTMLGADEDAAGRAYWAARLAEGPEGDGTSTAWQTLRRRFGEGRALWIVGQLDPFGRRGAHEQGDWQQGDGGDPPAMPTPPVAPAGWLDPARARALPDRFVITGYRGDSRVMLAYTSPVRPELPMSPSVGAPGDELEDTSDDYGPDAGVRWLTDFDEAVAAGMAARITVNKTIARSLERVVVFGVRCLDTAADSAATLESLLDAHAASAGLHFVRPLSPSNNTDTARSDFTTHDRDPRDSHARLLTGRDSSNAAAYQDRTVAALGISGGPFRHARNRGDLREREIEAMHAGLWPTTVGALLRDHVEATIHPDAVAFARGVFVDRVRPAGSLPCLRVGPQPYGLLPIVPLTRWISQSGSVRETILVHLLGSMRAKWRAALPDVPRIFDALDPQRALVEALSLAPTSRVLDGRHSSWSPIQKALDMQAYMTPWWSAVLPLLAQGEIDLFASYGGAVLTNRQSWFYGHRADSVDLSAPLIANQADKHAPLELDYISALSQNPLPSAVSSFSLVGAADKPLLYRLLGGAYIHHYINQFEPDRLAFFAALTELAGLDVETLEEVCAGAIDSLTHRLDAWICAIANLRLAELRASHPSGVQLGAFGWIEGLEPPGEAPIPGGPVIDDPDSAGYIHVHDQDQARTAAILHGGHLAHADQASAETLSIQLDSTRVRLARWLLEGMRAGQPLGALLGYRLERLLLAAGHGAHIHELRLALPLRVAVDDVSGDTLAGVNVVDGLQVLRAAEAAELEALVGAQLLADIEPSIDALALALDALSDLLLAEGVHQATRGNHHRAGAAFELMAEGAGSLPEIQVSATPSLGQSIEHRLVVILPLARTSGWPGDSGRPRALAEPRLNAWAAQLLGDPAKVYFTVTFTDAEGVQIRQVRTLAAYDLCALDLVWLAAARFEDARLLDCIRQLCVMQGPSGQGGFVGSVEVHGQSTKAPAGSRALDEVVALAHELAKVLRAGRPLDARHLQTGASSDGIDAAELTARASSLRAQVTAIGDAFTADPSAAQAWWRAAVLLGPVDPEVAGSSDAMLAELAKRDDAYANVDASEAEAEVASERIAALLDPDFLLAPTFTCQGAGPLDADFADQAALFDGVGLDSAELELSRWLADYARVRPACEALDMVLSLSDMHGGPTQLRAAQLPHAPGQRWIGAQLGRTGARPRLSLVAHLPIPTTLATTTVAGVLVDAWSETVPYGELTTGMSFHYDAPKARAPQSILLALPPRPGQAWTFADLEATLLETLELAKLRGVEARDLPGQGLYLPAVFLSQGMADDLIT